MNLISPKHLSGLLWASLMITAFFPTHFLHLPLRSQSTKHYKSSNYCELFSFFQDLNHPVSSVSVTLPDVSFFYIPSFYSGLQMSCYKLDPLLQIMIYIGCEAAGRLPTCFGWTIKCSSKSGAFETAAEEPGTFKWQSRKTNQLSVYQVTKGGAQVRNRTLAGEAEVGAYFFT